MRSADFYAFAGSFLKKAADPPLSRPSSATAKAAAVPAPGGDLAAAFALIQPATHIFPNVGGWRVKKDR